MYQNLINHIQSYVKLTDNELGILIENTSVHSLKNKEYLLQSGQICKSYYFVNKGCLRMFFHNEKGNEQTTQFALENWWLADYFSLSDQRGSEYYIQAVGKTEVSAIDNQSFEIILSEVPLLERYFRIMMQKAVAASQQRIKLLYSLSKEELYLHFSSYFPEFSQRVPQYMLASYLGLTPEYVSEIRKKKG